jgi:hypothetical protein
VVLVSASFFFITLIKIPFVDWPLRNIKLIVSLVIVFHDIESIYQYFLSYKFIQHYDKLFLKVLKLALSINIKVSHHQIRRGQKVLHLVCKMFYISTRQCPVRLFPLPSLNSLPSHFCEGKTHTYTHTPLLSPLSGASVHNSFCFKKITGAD